MRTLCRFSLFSVLFSMFGAASAEPNTDQTSMALRTLQEEIAAEARSGNQKPVQTALARHLVPTSSSFSVKTADSGGPSDSDAELLDARTRPPDFSDDEWRALRRTSLTEFTSESGNVTVRLFDADEDGLRDLLIRAYSGGTGLFTQYSMLRRIGDRFVEFPLRSEDDTGLYSESGRGGDEEGLWIQLQGHVYLAFREGVYGRETLHLRRAFAQRSDEAPVIRIRYRYRHTLDEASRASSGTSQTQTVALPPALRDAIQKALNRLTEAGEIDSNDPANQCPPESAPSDATEPTWPWVAPPYYTFDFVAALPLHHDGRCQALNIIAFKGTGSGQNPVSTVLTWLRSANDDGTDLGITTVRSGYVVVIEQGNDASPRP